jgi:hypothetical protein
MESLGEGGVRLIAIFCRQLIKGDLKKQKPGLSSPAFQIKLKTIIRQ